MTGTLSIYSNRYYFGDFFKGKSKLLFHTMHRRMLHCILFTNNNQEKKKKKKIVRRVQVNIFSRVFFFHPFLYYPRKKQNQTSKLHKNRFSLTFVCTGFPTSIYVKLKLSLCIVTWI